MLQTGDRLAHFEIERKLGEGGMGAVYLALDHKLGRRVALKIVSHDFLGDTQSRQRFEREARLAAQISHPNVMGIYDLGEAQSPRGGPVLTYIVMEYAEGQQLQRHTQTRKLNLASVLRIAERIAAGLAAAHKLNIVHRDIKPENIIVTADDEPKILDFGLAKPAAAPLQTASMEDDKTVAANLTQTGRIVGTFNYMSPEQAQGGGLDSRSDVFSFGILLYQLATGQAAFSGPTQISVIAKILEARHESIRKHDADLPPELERIIDKCLQKDPRERYQDTRDLVTDLRHLRRQLESGATQSSSTAGRPAMHATARAPRVRRRGFVWMAAALVMAAIASFWGLWGRDIGGGPTVAAGENTLAILQFENKTGSPELDWLSTGLPEILLTDLAQCTGVTLISCDRVRDEIKRSGGTTYTDWVQAGRKLGAATILSGSFFKLQDKIRIDARLEDSRTNRIRYANYVVGADPLALVDSLTESVMAELNMAATSQASVHEMTTSSAEAYRHYHLGNTNFLLGLYDKAREDFEAAIQEDSTFALPYLRMGMSHLFQGRQQLAQGFIHKAQQYKHKLPPRERSLLDVYYDAYVTNQYDRAYPKLEALVNAYPDDKEARSVFGAFVALFSADTTRAFAEFEKALSMDPTFPLAINIYAYYLDRYEQYARAIALMERLKKAYPESPAPYEALPGFYTNQGQLDKALVACEEFRIRFPDDPDIIPRMVSLANRSRDFDRALRYVDEIDKIKPNDVQWQRQAKSMRSNIFEWRGEFRRSLSELHESLPLARALGDSLHVFAAFANLGQSHHRYESPDSAVYYLRRADEYATMFNRIACPLGTVAVFPERADEVSPKFKAAIATFRKNLPSEVWPFATKLEALFGAYATRDTTQLVAAYRGLIELPREFATEENKRTLGELLARTGQHQDALDQFEKWFATPSTDAWAFLVTQYWAGVCYEGLGQRQQAIAKYREVLKYWDHADFKLEAIIGARRRLAALTSSS